MPALSADAIQDNVERVRARMLEAAARAGRSAEHITLVAVTKTWPAEVVVAAYEAGLRHFGENRAYELAEKRRQVALALPGVADLVWHQIGTLQSRKTRAVAESADVFHALDRLKIANRLSRELVEFGRTLPVMLEVNLSGEASKSGFAADRWQQDATQWRQLRTVIEAVAGLPGLELQGLMTMAPWDADERTLRSVFGGTRLLAEKLQEAFGDLRLGQLSMGMTDDFEIAIEEGATMVRVGRAIFGDRPAA